MFRILVAQVTQISGRQLQRAMVFLAAQRQKAGAAAVMNIGYYGHVMYVESVKWRWNHYR